MNLKSTVIIVGGAAGAKLVYDILTCNGMKVAGFVENYTAADNWSGIKPTIVGGIEDPSSLKAISAKGVDYFVATGNNNMRQEITNFLVKETGKLPINAVHPSAIISPHASMGTGNLICAGALVAVGSKIGNGAIVNLNVVLDHDNHIGDYAQISPGATLAGYVTVETRAFIGAGATVIPHLSVGADSVVAAGAAVIKDVEAATLVAGVPATQKKKLA